MVIGVAGIIPGVSGSVFAVLLGVYDRIVDAFCCLIRSPKRSLACLLPIAVGAVAGVLVSADPILYLCETFPVYTYCFFIGVMIGGIPRYEGEEVISGRESAVGKRRLSGTVAFCAAALTVIALAVAAHITGAGEEVTIYRLDGIVSFMALFAAGLVSCAAMTLPGVSGSVTLLLLGQYGTVYNAAGAPVRLIKALISGGSIKEEAMTSLLMLPFALGAAAGFFFASSAASAVEKKHPLLFHRAVCGFIVGSAVSLCLMKLMPLIFTVRKDFSVWLLIFLFMTAGAALSRLFRNKVR